MKENHDYKFLIHISMSRAGSGFLCSLINNHPSVFIPHFDNVNQGVVNSIIRKKNLSFAQKRNKVLTHFKSKEAQGRYIYYGMHIVNKNELDFLEKIGHCKLIISVRDTISSFCSRLHYEKLANKEFIPTAHIHSLTINTIVSSKFDYKKYSVFEVLLPSLHKDPKRILKELCIFLDIKFYKILFKGTKSTNDSINIDSLEIINDLDFNFNRYIQRSKKTLMSYRTQCFIYLFSRDFYKNIKVLKNYNFEDNIEFKNIFPRNIFVFLMVNELDKKIYKSIPKPFLFLNVISYFSLRYYLLLSFFGIKQSKLYNLSPYILIYILLKRIGLNNHNRF